MSGSVKNSSYAIIPAAGISRRMGQCKLLLPWPTNENPNGTLIDHLLSVWTSSRVGKVVVVIRKDDEQLARTCSAWTVDVVQAATPPADMKASIQVGLLHIAATYNPSLDDRCFIAPADLPGLLTEVIDRLIQTEWIDKSIVVPQFGNKRGHPVLMPWIYTKEIFELGDQQGVNWVVDRHVQQEVHFPASMYFSDVDTPEEYRLALQKRIPKAAE